MTFERYWNDKLCRSLKSPNLTGGPVARLGDSGHLGRNDSGTTIGTTFEQQPKNWRLRRLNRFLRSYALVCLSRELHQAKPFDPVKSIDLTHSYVLSRSQIFKRSKGSKKSKIQNQAFFSILPVYLVSALKPWKKKFLKPSILGTKSVKST